MKKQEELDDLDSCLNRAYGDELIFVLLARDVAGPATVRFWAEERVRLGKNMHSDKQILEARKWADAVEAGQQF